MRIILQDRFKLLKEGKIANDVFVKEANMLYPSLIKASLHADDAISILKRRNIIFEDVNQNTSEKSFESEFQKFLLEVKNEAPKDAKAVEKQTSKQVEDSYTRGHNFKDNTNPNNISNQQFMNGMMAEYGDPKNDGKTYDQFVDIVVKNLMKDPLFYVKNSAFGIKGIGYTDETPGLKASKTDQMTKVELQNNSTALKSNSRDVTDKIKTNKIKDEMTTTPKSQRGIQKMDLPGKEKKIKVNENRITESEEYQTEETYRYNGKTYYVWVDDEHNRFIKVYGRKIQINENQELSSEDVSKLFDYHERTGMLPDGIDAEEFKRLLKKYNISRDNDKDLDPAGGYGLSSHIEENMDGDTTPKYFENLESAKKWAREFSSKEGVGVHVNKTKSGGYNVEDWFDSDSTVASYENGNQFNESINKPFSALFEEELEDEYYAPDHSDREKPKDPLEGIKDIKKYITNISDLVQNKLFMRELEADDLTEEEAIDFLQTSYNEEDIQEFHDEVYGLQESIIDRYNISDKVKIDPFLTTDPINKQGEEGTIISLEKEYALIKFNSGEMGRYQYGTFSNIDKTDEEEWEKIKQEVMDDFDFSEEDMDDDSTEDEVNRETDERFIEKFNREPIYEMNESKIQVGDIIPIKALEDFDFPEGDYKVSFVPSSGGEDGEMLTLIGPDGIEYDFPLEYIKQSPGKWSEKTTNPSLTFSITGDYEGEPVVFDGEDLISILNEMGELAQDGDDFVNKVEYYVTNENSLSTKDKIELHNWYENSKHNNLSETNKEITENMDPLHVFRKYLLQENNKPITESKKVPVSKKIAEIEKNSVTIALESKINAIDEEITRRSNQIKMVEENEDLSELVDKTRMKELQKEIKLLEKQKDKYVKLYEKQTGKKKQEVVTDSTADAAEDSPIEEASEGDVAAQEELTKAIEGTKSAAEELDKVSQDSGLVEEIQPTEDELTAMKSELESYIDMVGDFEEAVEMYLNFHPEHAKYKTMLRQLAEPMF